MFHISNEVSQLFLAVLSCNFFFLDFVLQEVDVVDSLLPLSTCYRELKVYDKVKGDDFKEIRETEGYLLDIFFMELLFRSTSRLKKKQFAFAVVLIIKTK